MQTNSSMSPYERIGVIYVGNWGGVDAPPQLSCGSMIDNKNMSIARCVLCRILLLYRSNGMNKIRVPQLWERLDCGYGC